MRVLWLHLWWRVNKIEQLSNNLVYLDNPHKVLGIFRSCLCVPKTVCFVRCNTPSEESSVILQDFDNLQFTDFENMLDTVISDNARKQACVLVSKTGVGIRGPVDQLKAAYVRSVSQTESFSKLNNRWENSRQPNVQINSGGAEKSRNYPICTTQDSGCAWGGRFTNFFSWDFK